MAFDVCLLQVMCPLWYVPAPVKGSLRAEVAPVGVTWLRVGCGVAGRGQQLQKLEFPLLCPVPLLIDPNSLESCMIGAVNTSKHYTLSFGNRTTRVHHGNLLHLFNGHSQGTTLVSCSCSQETHHKRSSRSSAGLQQPKQLQEPSR